MGYLHKKVSGSLFDLRRPGAFVAAAVLVCEKSYISRAIFLTSPTVDYKT